MSTKKPINIKPTAGCRSLTAAELAEELEAADNKNTKAQDRKTVNAFERALQSNEFEIKDIWQMDQKELDRNLAHFYLGARTLKNDYYKIASMEAFRCSIIRILAEHQSEFDIKEKKAFPVSNKAWKRMTQKLKAEGKAVVDGAQEISEEGKETSQKIVLAARFNISLLDN